MGEHAALTALEWQIAREEQDELAAPRTSGSRRPTSAASSTTRSRRSAGSSATRTCAPDSTVEKLATLKPVFGKGEAATMTAGNSTPLTDGASVVLLGLGGVGQGARPAGRWPTSTAYETAAVDYVHGGEGLLMAPAYAMARMLERAGLSLQDFDFYEIHEAFASQVLATLKAWEDPVFCKERLGLDAPLGSIDRAQAQRQRLLAGRRPPVRRDRRPHRRHARQAARREGQRPRR